MSLIDDFTSECVMIDKKSVPDGYGGFTPSWVVGAGFSAAITLDNSMQSRIAEQQGVTALYTVTSKKNINLQYHDVFKRLSDGKIFRVTSDGDDKATPISANLNMRQVSAEEWTLPGDLIEPEEVEP
jgi:hypothetical protein